MGRARGTTRGCTKNISPARSRPKHGSSKSPRWSSAAPMPRVATPTSSKCHLSPSVPGHSPSSQDLPEPKPLRSESVPLAPQSTQVFPATVGKDPEMADAPKPDLKKGTPVVQLSDGAIL